MDVATLEEQSAPFEPGLVTGTLGLFSTYEQARVTGNVQETHERYSTAGRESS